MPYIVVIDKMGAVKETNIKEYKESDLFKKAGFKSAEGFVLQHIWKDSAPDRGEIAVYAKKNGKAGQENKYEFPPPIDSVLFFGSCVLVKRQNGAVVDLRLTEWNDIYNKLMGGFEDLGSADDDDEGDTEEEELLANGAKLGKEGYILDDFIVEDERDEEDYDAFSESSKSEKEIEKKTKKKMVKKPSDKNKESSRDKVSSKKKEKTTNIIVAPLVEERKEEMYLDCEMELVEEAYV